MSEFLQYRNLMIDGRALAGPEAIGYCSSSNQDHLRALGGFLSEWFDDKPTVSVYSSGSTGTPKRFEVLKDQMLASARATAQFFGFQKGQTALLALPTQYIAGKMMVVRALCSKLNLLSIPPSNSPFSMIAPDREIHFAAFTPSQMVGVRDTFRVRTILLGGAPIGSELEQSLVDLPAEIYHGYGMTETLSHVALRKVSAQSAAIYSALPGVSFLTDARSCLVIRVPFLSEEVVTNDVVELFSSTRFVWKGRFDHVVNSGGLKLFPEELEKKIAPFFSRAFFLAGLPDARLGEKLCLLIEGPPLHGADLQELQDRLRDHLGRFERPKEIYFLPAFSRTGTAKVQRAETIRRLLP